MAAVVAAVGAHPRTEAVPAEVAVRQQRVAVVVAQRQRVAMVVAQRQRVAVAVVATRQQRVAVVRLPRRKPSWRRRRLRNQS